MGIRQFLGRCLGAALVFACLGLVPALGHARVLDFGAAQFVLAEGSVPPPASAPWQSVALPDRWRETHPQAQGVGWYRLTFEGNDLTHAVQAIYLPHASLNVVVYLNGQEVGRAGPLEEPHPRTWNRPRLYVLPPTVLQSAHNVLHLRVQGHAYTQASLFPPRVGPESDLREVYDDAYFLRITLNQLATLLIMAVSLLMFSLWWRRRKDVAYGYMALSALVWSAQSTNLFLLLPPVATAYWEIFVNSSFQVFSALLLLSMLRFVGLHWRPVHVALGLSCAVSPALMLVVPASGFLQLTTLAHMFTLGSTVVVLCMLLWEGLRHRNTDAQLLLGVLGAIVLFALHDWLLHSKHSLPPELMRLLPVDMYLLQYSAPFIFLAIGWIMTVRFVRVLNQFEALTQELDQRVQAKSVELEASYTRLQALERERAVQEERERIHSDLHDDVGAKLLTLVYRAPSPEHADLARSALQDLRDVVSRPGEAAPELEYLVGDWRSECEQRLHSAHMALDWQQDPAVDGQRLAPQQALNLGRILRESVSNAIRHAQASQLGVRLRMDGAVLHLHVTDNGQAPPEQLKRQGSGTRNMQARAQAMGGQFTRAAVAPCGCHVHVSLPLNPPS